MFKIRKQFFLFLLSCFVIFAATAGDLDKAFKYLNTGDYPNASKYLREAIGDEADNPAANYGLAKYFSSKDNSAYNLDSAIRYINLAAKKIPLNPEDRQTKKLLALGVREYTITTLQKSINFEAYQSAEQTNSLESYQHFIDNFNDQPLLEQAVNFRNQKAYMRAMSLKTPAAIDEFIKNFPQAAEVKEAKERYEKMLYDETTADKKFESYKKYLDSYPNGAYVKEATKIYNEKLVEFYNSKHDLAAYIEFERNYKTHPAFKSIQDSIYVLATKESSVAAYKNFIMNYQQNPHYKEAWEQLYILSTADGTQNSYLQFIQNFPSFPNKDRAYKDLELAAKDLNPFQRGEKWGYAYTPTLDSLVIFIDFEYDEAFPFKGGLASVRNKACAPLCSYFYIDKNNQRAFAGDYNYAGDFENGLAVVGIGNCESSECKYGMINKLGKLVIPAEYDEINDLQEGLYLASKDSKYGFLDQNGQTVISHKYTDALPFSMGVAAVAIDGNWFFIDKTGAQKFINRFLDISSFSDSLCAVTQDKESWGYIDMTGNFVIQPLYETAEDFQNGFAIVSKKEKDPKNKSLFISQRYRIDKTGKVIEKLTAPKEPGKKNIKKKGRR